jgi:hypothetical protein
VKRDLMTVVAVVALVMSAGVVLAQVAAPAAPAAPVMPAVEPAAVPAEAAPAESEMQDVESSLIKEVGYDAVTKVLTVIFVKGDEKYLYKNVPADVYAALMVAESKGKYFVENIKGKFEFAKE